MLDLVDTQLVHSLSFDPGGTTGVACWNDEGQLLGMGNLSGEDALFKFLDKFPAKEYIYESFELYPWKNQKGEMSWQKFEVVEAIGAIKYAAARNKAPAVAQKASIKKVAYMQSGVRHPGTKSIEHQFDALIHGYWYLVHTAKRIPVGPLN